MTQTSTATTAARHLRGRPAAATTTLHIGPEHVSASDLAEYRDGADLASLTLGDAATKVVLLGSLPELCSIVVAALRLLNKIESNRLATSKRHLGDEPQSK